MTTTIAADLRIDETKAICSATRAITIVRMTSLIGSIVEQIDALVDD